ncbi:MAG: glycogen/starch/alpha-glucan phosphorylase [Geothrix sp.]|uniref:glycogen/starch/alpha-glucan phosphorylase n=1 Tax=Geothrix sp. TaxID=1962974 RepID=UPI00181384A8|nr:glycogen/starch/alpha-glucan phosphorylase [Geothrix sp.]NWJ39923.1 glycogen/starch/alpha-glucan phosphorylase [Geothrix sp.]WIL22065.1 MAG: glycogen/starch/alpha-glucan phosphorylase [Geothrix sp.]
MTAGPRNIPTPRAGGMHVPEIIDAFAHRMMYSIAKDSHTASDFDVYQGLAFAVRDRLMERWFGTQSAYYRQDAKRVYYLSLEFLMGRALLNNVVNLGAGDAYSQAMGELGFRLEDITEQEWDAGLGNGGLGRLAACILDAAATLELPFYGYGIRYEYGIFYQKIIDGQQTEFPDGWLRYGNPWEIQRPDAIFPVRFYGRTQGHFDADGRYRVEWLDTQDVWAMAYDTPIAGYRNGTVNTLRLWSAKSSREFDLARFNSGQYVRAVEDKTISENISKVLYPADDQSAGKELRLKQQYFFVSATLQDVVRRFKKRPSWRWEDLPDKVAVQMNDTHPALVVPELMRVLLDQEGLEWDLAWGLTQQVCAYTNHTILPEAMEVWPMELWRNLLPRHAEIVEEVDRRFRLTVRERYPFDDAKLQRLAIVDNGHSVRMANLAIVGSHSVNGVAQLHTDILKASTFAEMNELFPGRLNNKTNGITPRRWLLKCNPGLASLVTEAIGEGWTRDLDALRGLERFAGDAAFQERWTQVKRANKEALATWAGQTLESGLDPAFLFDVQVKRIHEYKRQLLNLLHVATLWNRLRDGGDAGVPRAVMIGGKAAPAYWVAKQIIHLTNAMAQAIQADPATRGRLSLAFLPNYRVTLAELIFPAAELSEQISTAGTEASGTGNMKAALNGALTIGTLDGANIEIKEEVGEANIFIFGHTAEGIVRLRDSGHRPGNWIQANPELRRAIDTISTLDGGRFQSLGQILLDSDHYFHCADYASYLEGQEQVSATYADPREWARRSILNVAGMGKFSIDRTVREYARDIWKAAAVPVPLP